MCGVKILSPQTVAWCVERGHPWVTYNPLMNRTWCRCGERRQDGAAEVDWEAKWEIFHDHKPDEPCRCYPSERAS